MVALGFSIPPALNAQLNSDNAAAAAVPIADRSRSPRQQHQPNPSDALDMSITAELSRIIAEDQHLEEYKDAIRAEYEDREKTLEKKLEEVLDQRTKGMPQQAQEEVNR